MTEEQESKSIVAILAASVYFADEYYDKLMTSVATYIKNHRSHSIADYSKFDNKCQLNILFNNIKYHLQVVIFSPCQSYSVISGNNFSTFKVTNKSKKSIKLVWNDKEYLLNVDKNGSKISVNFSNSKSLIIQRVKDSSEKLRFLNFSFCELDEDLSSLDSFKKSLLEINCIIKGFCLPEPHFTQQLEKNLKIIFTNLQDPLLPAQYFKEYLNKISQSLPSTFIMDLQNVIAIYSNNSSSIFSKFPSNKILSLIERFLNQIKDIDRKNNFSLMLCQVLELAEMFSNGMRGYAQRLIEEILNGYINVEKKFQMDINEISSNEFKNICTSLIGDDLISHSNLEHKNTLIIALMDCVEKHLPGLVVDLKPAIQKMLSSLKSSKYNSIVVKLREVLVICQVPSYEVRKNKMEAILLKNCSESNESNNINSLENLINSNSAFFDIISDFFYHNNAEVSKCALEVYFRRAFLVYNITSFQQIQTSSGQLGVIFKYTEPLLTIRKKTELKRSNSILGIMNIANKQKMSQNSFYPKKFSTSRQSSGNSSLISAGSQDDSQLIINQYYPVSNDNSSNGCYNQCKTPATYTDTDDSALSTGPPSTTGVSTDLDSMISESPNIINCNNNNNGSGGGKRFNQTIYDNTSPYYSSQMDKPPSINSLNRIEQYRDNVQIRHGSIFVSHTNDYLDNLRDSSSWGEMGVAFIFRTLDELSRDFESLMASIEKEDAPSDYFLYNISPEDNFSTVTDYKLILYIILNDHSITQLNDEEISVKFLEFCQEHYFDFHSNNTVWVTFMLQSMENDIRYFTYHCKSNFEEDKMCRQIDPALSFQLELSRLRFYHLERMSVPDKRLYVYLGKKENLNLTPTKEYRIFVRCILHHKHLSCATSSLEYLAHEAERSVVEALEAVEMVSNNKFSNQEISETRSNHIFFFFHSVLILDRLEQLEDVVRRIVLKYGRRLWSAKITQAELKLTVRLNSEFNCQIPVRLWVHNDGGNSLDIGIYREETNSGINSHKILIAIGGSYSKEARYHGLPAVCCYSL